jgi:hypothetical protein
MFRKHLVMVHAPHFSTSTPGTFSLASSARLRIIIMSKPPALPGNSKSLTVPGVLKSFSETLRIPGDGGVRRITSETSNGTFRAFPRHLGSISRPHRRGDSEGVSTWQGKQCEAPIQVDRFERFTNSSLQLCRRSMTHPLSAPDLA